ncbi:toxin-antitoxin system toxin component RelE family [Cryptobacterium sp. CAG:338]|nr:toxin-antitoxin system toxin component RelE family [Cryptobacterium sp. CAG:338]
MFHINYYEDINGNVPIREFIEGLNLKLKVKVFGCIELLEQYGNQLGMPFSRYLRDEIFELRILQGIILFGCCISITKAELLF